MDISSLLSTVLSESSVSNMSQAANVSTGDVQSVLTNALPSLLNGALEQSTNTETVQGFEGALSDHSADDTSDLQSFLSNVDIDDGAKIVSHLLGSNSSSTIDQISEQSGVSAGDTKNIMSAAAPLIMSLLGKEANNQKEEDSSIDIASIMGSLLKNVDIGSILSGLLGSSGDSAPQTSSSNGSGSSGGLFGLLGKLFKR